MDAKRWGQIKEIYDRALDLPGEERDGFLAEACAGDDDLQGEIETLLAAHNDAGTFLQAPPVEFAAREIVANEDTSPAPQLIGRELANYRVVSLLGRGGMGEVYLVEDKRLHRKVALKLLAPQFTNDAERVRRFEREARAVSALNHPNIVTIFDIGQAGALHFIAIEFIEGRTLRELIRNGGMKLGEALEVATQVASALSAAHAAGIVHRDIKPENIMLRPDGYVKVLDFGLAKLGVESGELGVGNRESGIGEQVACPHSPLPTPHFPVSTDPWMVLGTVNYMSPEQARGLETDARSDIFSLGIVLYEMITSHRPFEGETPSDVIVALLSQEPPFTEHAPDLPGELQRMVGRMLAKDCVGRYQTADEARRALKRLKWDLTPARDFKTREFSGLARLARRFGRAGATEEGKTVITTTRDPPQSKSGVIFFPGRFNRPPLRVALALMALAALIAAAILGRQWLNRRDSSIDSIAVLPF